MKALIKLMLILALFFASTFIVIKLTGVISVDKIETWLSLAKEINLFYVALVVTALLFADLFIAVPTLTVMILSGYFLGHFYGAIASITGVMLAGICGYVASYLYGEKLEKLIVKNLEERKALRAQFEQYGVFMILLSRAMPILPEVTACMSGITRMNFGKFLIAWICSSVPYAIIATYAGSISTLDNPKPAIITAIGLTTIFWSGWFIFRKVQKYKANRQQAIQQS
ncbi:hypothetical protein tinsulaeT_10740 [Thalassotalea insulae]|uniref:VTT domain-containing protein n=1 Tax=Thalassotalea insulae TaxID=2056778 RepID=A0ABQ6GQW8_9GAMM|nr:VTT domain-containing protein [Thalassotalea insulae]GLX77734.1 hypothetical protein tinsulaeT_10740 [Thalassotalea insulae]